jgi:hypothetical protein
MRENDRYQRASLGEHLGDLLGWLRSHRFVSVVLLLFAVGWLAQIVAPQRPTGPTDLAVGHCLFARTSDANLVGPGVRPIGLPVAVEAVVMVGGAERAPCDGSHGHEVSTIVPLADLPVPSSGDVIASLRALVQPKCDAEFDGFVGAPAGASIHETFAAVPNEAGWRSGERTGLCLVVRVDGQWMTSPARGSQE